MTDSFSEKLQTILQDGESMEKIRAIAEGFARADKENGTAPGTAPIGEAAASVGDLQSLARLFGAGGGERLALLRALRPFVRAEKQPRLDRIIETVQALELLSRTAGIS